MFTGIFFSEKFLHIDGGMSAYPQRSQISRPCDHQISPFLEFSGKKKKKITNHITDTLIIIEIINKYFPKSRKSINYIIII